MKEIKNTEIKSPNALQDYDDPSDYPLYCPFCKDNNLRERKNFLQIAPLEELKRYHKHSSTPRMRRKFYTIVLLTKGEMYKSIGAYRYKFKPGELCFIAKNQLHSIHYWSDDVQGFIVSLMKIIFSCV